jgi:hypothetical protein
MYYGTPLHVAAQHKQDGAMKILLDHHAHISFTIRFIVSYSYYIVVLSLESGQVHRGVNI